MTIEFAGFLLQLTAYVVIAGMTLFSIAAVLMMVSGVIALLLSLFMTEEEYKQALEEARLPRHTL